MPRTEGCRRRRTVNPYVREKNHPGAGWRGTRARGTSNLKPPTDNAVGVWTQALDLANTREGRAMSPRQRLPHRRASDTFELEVGGLKYTCALSRYGDARIAEIFLSNTKPSSQSDVNARDAAVAVS